MDLYGNAKPQHHESQKVCHPSMVKQVELIEQSTEQDRDGTYKWKVRCGCGKEFLALKRAILNGVRKSCGCLKKKSAQMRAIEGQIHTPQKDTIIKNKFHRYKTSARIKSHKFDLEFEHFSELTESGCHYCGDFRLEGVGLDRLDNSRGYEADNVVPCCSQCNYIKAGLSHSQFVEFIQKVYRNLTNYQGS